MRKLMTALLAAMVVGGVSFAGELENASVKAGSDNFGWAKASGGVAVNMNGFVSGAKAKRASYTGEAKSGEPESLGAKVAGIKPAGASAEAGRKNGGFGYFVGRHAMAVGAVVLGGGLILAGAPLIPCLTGMAVVAAVGEGFNAMLDGAQSGKLNDMLR